MCRRETRLGEVRRATLAGNPDGELVISLGFAKNFGPMKDNLSDKDRSFRRGEDSPADRTLRRDLPMRRVLVMSLGTVEQRVGDYQQ